MAQGIDEAAHQGALQHQRTIAVMGTGRTAPIQVHITACANRFLECGGAVITEFLPQTKPLQQTFSKT